MGSQECVCGCPKSLLEDADGKQVYMCLECGTSDTPAHFDDAQYSIEAFDHGAGGNFVGVNGDGARPEGFRNYTKHQQLSDGRKAGLNIITILCQRFNVPQYIKSQMVSILQDKKLRCGRFETMAYATFLYIHRGWHEKPRVVTLKEVAAIADPEAEEEEEIRQKNHKPKKRRRKSRNEIKAKDINTAFKNLIKYACESGLNNYQLQNEEPSFEEDRLAYPQWVMPALNGSLKCPFTFQDISPRVIKLTEKLLEVIYRRCTNSCNRTVLTVMPLAASYLAYQSCFFYRSPSKDEVLPGPQLNRTIIQVGEFLTTIGFKYCRAELNAIRKNLTIIRNILKEMLQVMVWIRPSRANTGKKETPTVMSRRYLDEILRFSNWSIEYLVKKEEAERAALPFIPPSPPTELTDVQKAALESPELSEKDLTEAEANEYLRDPDQVEAMKGWLNDTSGSDDTDDEEE